MNPHRNSVVVFCCIHAVSTPLALCTNSHVCFLLDVSEGTTWRDPRILGDDASRSGGCGGGGRVARPKHFLVIVRSSEA